MGDIFGDIFGVLFQVQIIWYKLLSKTRGTLEMPMKKKKIVLSSRKQGKKYVQNIMLVPCCTLL
jgi:hypothetical protein